MNYQKLFNYMYEQHDMTMLESEMREIVLIVQQMIEDDKPDDPQPKTIREWFEELPEPYRSEALEFVNTPDLPAAKMSSAIGRGMNWKATRSGASYWNDLFEKYRIENM